MRMKALLRSIGAVALLWPASAVSQAPAECSRNADQSRWFVRAGAGGDGIGTRDRPFGSLADIERCAPAGATITVLAAADTAARLDGGIKLKDRQKLLGVEPPRGTRPAARVTNTAGTGDAVTLAHGNEVAHLHIDGPTGAAILGDNVTGAMLRDLLVTERSPTPRSQLDPSLCRVVRTGGAVDNAQSVLRGCGGNQVPAVKGAIVLLADDGAGAAPITYTLQRVTIRDNPSHEKPEFLWSLGVQVLAAGRAAVTLDLLDSSIEFTVRGLGLRGTDRASVTANVTNTWFDSLRSDGISMVTGFVCSGLDTSTKVAVDCSKLAPAPVSDARVVFNADRFRFTDTRGHGQLNDQAAIEPIAYDQGRSTIEVHVQRSDLTGAAAPAMFTFYPFGRPARDIMDLGCVNPAPDATAPDPAACRKLGYTSAGGNRIFGNARNRPHVEIALQGPGTMMAQGNYWGDLKPADGKGDVLGDCSLFVWSGNQKEEPPPYKAVPQARCELYDIPSQGNPTAIDGRFPLASDPRPPK
jgi:hypothetical protein